MWVKTSEPPCSHQTTLTVFARARFQTCDSPRLHVTTIRIWNPRTLGSMSLQNQGSLKKDTSAPREASSVPPPHPQLQMPQKRPSWGTTCGPCALPSCSPGSTSTTCTTNASLKRKPSHIFCGGLDVANASRQVNLNPSK